MFSSIDETEVGGVEIGDEARVVQSKFRANLVNDGADGGGVDGATKTEPWRGVHRPERLVKLKHDLLSHQKICDVKVGNLGDVSRGNRAPGEIMKKLTAGTFACRLLLAKRKAIGFHMNLTVGEDRVAVGMIHSMSCRKRIVAQIDTRNGSRRVGIQSLLADEAIDKAAERVKGEIMMIEGR